LAFERLTAWPAKLAKVPGGRVLSVMFVLLQVIVAWVFFRATSVEHAGHMLRTMFAFNLSDLRDTLANNQYECMLMAFVVFRHIWVWNVTEAPTMMNERKPWLRTLYRLEPLGLAIVAALSIILRGPGRDFVYFQF
jgi:hypothetical protein